MAELPDLYGDVFQIMDEIWADGDRMLAAGLALATDGTTSGEILPKLRAALQDALRSPTIERLGLDQRIARSIDEIDRIMGPYERGWRDSGRASR
jgi:hypothetical protein